MTKSAASGSRALVPWLLLAGACWASAAGDAEARFQGTGKADPIRIANVTCKPADAKGAGTVTFDLAWDHSWRAAWEDPEARHGGKGTLKLESWDAAWVFVKFHKPGADGFSHATLSTNAAEHAVPSGAKLDVGLADDGQRGVGVFIYRGAPGNGSTAWKGVTLRWLYGADGVSNLDKVFVQSESGSAPRPKAGGAPSLNQPADADDDEISKALGAAVAETEAAAAATRTADHVEIRVFAIPMVFVPEGAFWVGDGAASMEAQFSAGDTSAPLRIESERALTLGGAAADSLGNRDSLGIWHHAEDFASSVTRQLPARFPKGYAAFYGMKRLVTRAEYAAFFSTLSAGQQSLIYPGDELGPDPQAPGVSMRWSETAAYAAWAGLRR